MRPLVHINIALLCLSSLVLPILGVDNNSHRICSNGADCQETIRREYTIRASAHDGDDISAEFEQGLRSANNGGTLRLIKGKRYVIGKKLDLKNLNDVHLNLEGEIKFTNNVAYWQKENVQHPFQNSISFWRWSGNNIKIYGKGMIHGNGQTWWDGFQGKEILLKNPSNGYLRPILFYVENATNVEVSEINFLHSPAWFTFIVNARNVSFDRCTFYAKSLSKARPKNTDGFDTYNVDGFRLTNSRLTVDDDCFSAKPNTTNVLVENVWCDGSHGVSMGSIGQYPGVLDYISNVMVRNVTLLNGQNGARLKAWAGKDKGYGYIKNITFQDLAIENTDQPIVLDQCYFNVKGKECLKYPSKVNISDIKFINIHGTSSAKRGCVVGSLKCSPAAECKNIELQNIDLRSPLEEGNDEEAKPTGKGAKGKIICDGIVGPRGLGVDCVSSSAAGC